MPGRRRISLLALLGAVTAAPVAASPNASPGTAIYDTLGGAENGGDSFASAGPILVDQILTGTTPASLKKVVVLVSASKPDLGSFEVIITQVGHTGAPFLRQVVGTVSDMSLTTTFAKVDVLPTTPITLAANTRYYVGIHRVSGGKSHVVLGNTLDTSVLERLHVKQGGLYFNNGGVQANSGGPYELAVIATTSPSE